MVQVPLHLWNRPHWELNGRPDSEIFFRILKQAFPSATALFVEGTGIAAGVQDFYRSAVEPGPHLPARQTLWPRPKQFRLPADDYTLERLAALAASHAEPELLDHLFVYAGGEPLLEYPDAFTPGSPIFLAREIPEERIRSFAAQLQLQVASLGTTA